MEAGIATETPAEKAIPRLQPYRLRWVVAAVVLAANVMDLLDSTIINVAAPSVHHSLGGGATTIQWLSAGYTLAFAVLLIAGARLGDILGRRRLFLIGSAQPLSKTERCYSTSKSARVRPWHSSSVHSGWMRNV